MIRPARRANAGGSARFVAVLALRVSLASLASLALCATACSTAGTKYVAKTVSKAPSPVDARWEDAFDTVPTLLAVAHPQAIRRDPVYGPLLRRLSELAQTRSPAIAATRSLEAFESAEEVLAAMQEGGDKIVVLRGVRADLDPLRIVDAGGRPLWRSTSVPMRVQELEREEGGEIASLFVLPGRTWVIALGACRQRVRDAFANGVGRPPLVYDRVALLSVRIHGPSLIGREPRLGPGGKLESLGHALRWVSLAIDSGKAGTVNATLTYADVDSAIDAESTAHRVVDAFGQSAAPRVRWIGGAEIARAPPQVVSLRARLPAGLLRGLAAARDAPDLENPAP